MKLATRYRLLAAVSGAQLAFGGAGLAAALRRGHAYDFLWMHGRRDKVARDALLMGTAMSAPVPMLVTQAVLTAVVTRRRSRHAARGIGALGAAMVAGYVVERHVRRRLTPSGWDAVESSVVIGGIGLAGAMAALGLPGDPADHTGSASTTISKRSRATTGGRPVPPSGVAGPRTTLRGLVGGSPRSR
ncbi:MAG: hypothetical protein H0V19_04655 [Euzebyales bacterium]|nr:hypothetical protein [Euzebyales bacterium]